MSFEDMLPAVPKQLMRAKKLKVVLVGDTNVGKSSYFHRIRSCYTLGGIIPTVGMAYTNVLVRPLDGTAQGDACESVPEDLDEQMCGLWDTAGQEKFQSLLPMYLRGSDLVILVHEGTERSKKRFLDLLDMFDNEIPKAAVYMVQNKADVCAFDEAFLNKVQHRIVGWSHTSALSAKNVESSFVDAVACCNRYRANNISEKKQQQQHDDKDLISIREPVPKQQRWWCSLL